MNIWYNLVEKLKNVYEFILDMDNLLRLIVNMLQISLFVWVFSFAINYCFYFFFEPWALSTSSPFNPSLFIYFIIYLLIILVYCLLIREYIGNKRILSVCLVVPFIMIFFFYDPHFMGCVLCILFFIWLNHYVEKFFEFEEYNHPPINY